MVREDGKRGEMELGFRGKERLGVIEGEGERVSEVVLNVYVNGIEGIGEDGVIRVRGRERGGGVKMRVRERGKGIGGGEVEGMLSG